MYANVGVVVGVGVGLGSFLATARVTTACFLFVESSQCTPVDNGSARGTSSSLLSAFHDVVFRAGLCLMSYKIA